MMRHLTPVMLAALLAACGDSAPPPPEPPRPVRVATAETRTAGEVVTLAGTVQPQVEVSLGFRIPGRIAERLVNAGDRVQAGQVLARLDRENEDNNWRAARAALVAAQAALVEARNNQRRQAELLRTGFTTRVQYDRAVQQLAAATSNVEAAQAQFAVAEDRIGYTELVADAPGTVLTRRAETGEVVAAGQPIYVIAREGGQDAIFAVPAALKDAAPANPEIAVSLSDNPGVSARGRVREVSPRADPVTGAFEVRVGLIEPPEALRLGAAITGRLQVGEGGGIELPASALVRADGGAAVWVVDPRSKAVALRPVEVARHGTTRITLARGVEAGEAVVTAGVQTLRPGQVVRLLGEAR